MQQTAHPAVAVITLLLLLLAGRVIICFLPPCCCCLLSSLLLVGEGMVQQLLPWDTLFLAGFAYSGYRTLGRWLKYTDDVAKRQSGARDTHIHRHAQRHTHATAAAATAQQLCGCSGCMLDGQGHVLEGARERRVLREARKQAYLSALKLDSSVLLSSCCCYPSPPCNPLHHPGPPCTPLHHLSCHPAPQMARTLRGSGSSWASQQPQGSGPSPTLVRAQTRVGSPTCGATLAA